MKIVVTGPRGFVGARIAGIPSPSLRDFNEDDVKRMVDTLAPDVLVHTAAISDISTCEKNPEASYRANVEIPLWIARTGVKAVLFSTDQVYCASEKEGPYAEEDTAPGNTYAAHKLEMERRVLDANPDAVLLRATWMYDMPLYGAENRGNFLMNMLRQREIAFSATQRRAVTYVREVADWMEKAALLPGGVYNYGSENDLTMLETAEWLKDTLNLPVVLRDAGPRHNLWMDCGKLKKHGISFLNTVDGLKKCVGDYNL